VSVFDEMLLELKKITEILETLAARDAPKKGGECSYACSQCSPVLFFGSNAKLIAHLKRYHSNAPRLRS
jgi:hypothetical protein